jgi:FkbM family methyltransferase
MGKQVSIAKIGVALNVPDDIIHCVTEVLGGEYESFYFGENLTVLDIGAHVGSFTIWANLRWPNSRVHAYEPHPETFKVLATNVEAMPNVTCHNFAVYPSEKESELFWSRFAGDAEAGLVADISKVFKNLAEENITEARVLHPRKLPKADIVKLDVEGAEALILGEMNLQEVSLILLEYHNAENRDAIKELLKNDFTLEYEETLARGNILPDSDYKQELRGNYTGKLFFASKRHNRLAKYD